MLFKSKAPEPLPEPCGSERIVSLAPISLSTLVCTVPKVLRHDVHWQSEELDGVTLTFAWSAAS